VTSISFVALLVVLVFAIDMISRWWRSNEWRRRNRHSDDD
jgi:ABC-type phosphate/phosphonate transport system permease subunit